MSGSNSESDVDFSKLKVAELKQELKKRGLSVDGKKSDLIERLQTSIGDSALLDDAHDDLLDDDDLSDEVLDDSAIDTPPEPVVAKASKRPGEEEKRHPKKIILNRKVVEAPDPPPETETSTPTSVTSEPLEKKSEPAPVIKLTGLTQKERLEKRAARFGAALSAPAAAAAPEAAKEVRGIQFGETPSASASAPAASGVNIDILRKRAERFGTVAPILEKAQLEEKKKLRMNRFGVGKAEEGTKVITGVVAANGDKKAQRAARFEIKS